jgi:hypothetical protein
MEKTSGLPQTIGKATQQELQGRKVAIHLYNDNFVNHGEFDSYQKLVGVVEAIPNGFGFKILPIKGLWKEPLTRVAVFFEKKRG